MLIGWGVMVGVGVTVGVCVAVEGVVAAGVGVFDGIGESAELVTWRVFSPVTGSSSGSSGVGSAQAAVRMAMIRKVNHIVEDLRILRMLDTCKSCGSEI
jgi:hypothetical protein